MADNALQTNGSGVVSAKILATLAKMAERLKLSSNQAILLYAGNNFWLNSEMSDVSFSILKKLATDRNIDLFELDEPFVLTLIKQGVFTPDEQALFGWQPQPEITVSRNGTASAPKLAARNRAAKR